MCELWDTVKNPVTLLLNLIQVMRR
jgi:hypothetical protein